MKRSKSTNLIKQASWRSTTTTTTTLFATSCLIDSTNEYDTTFQTSMTSQHDDYKPIDHNMSHHRNRSHIILKYTNNNNDHIDSDCTGNNNVTKHESFNH